MGPGAEQFAHALQQVLDVGGGRLQLDTPRLELGQVEHVVDQAQEVVRAILQGLQVGSLGGVQRRGAEQARHADDAVQGSPDLVAEQGEDLLAGARLAVAPAASLACTHLRHIRRHDAILTAPSLMRAQNGGWSLCVAWEHT